MLPDRCFVYESQMMADDLPYLPRTGAGELVEIRPHWGADDWPPFAHYEEIGAERAGGCAIRIEAFPYCTEPQT